MIEDRIDKLIAAIEANTAVLTKILESSGAPAPAAEPEAKPAKAPKKEKPADLKVVEPEAPAAEAPKEEEEAPAAEAPKHSIEDALAASKAKLALDRDAYKPKLAALREKFGIDTVKDLKEDQIDAYMAELAKL